MIAVAAQVLEADARPVRAAPEVDAPIAERRAHLVQVLDGDGGHIEARVGVERREATRDQRLGKRVLEKRLQRRLLVVLAVERVGVARAALVDEHDVAHVVEPREQGQHLGGERDRALARAARQHEDRIGFARAHPGGHDGDVEPDSFELRGGLIPGPKLAHEFDSRSARS